MRTRVHGLTIKAGTCFLNTPKREMFLDQRFVVLVARTVKMCGDADFFFVFPRALQSSQGPVYLGSCRKQL